MLYYHCPNPRAPGGRPHCYAGPPGGRLAGRGLRPARAGGAIFFRAVQPRGVQRSIYAGAYGGRRLATTSRVVG